jgi:hypothetical protein
MDFIRAIPGENRMRKEQGQSRAFLRDDESSGGSDQVAIEQQHVRRSG